jgi:hypothetical protein
LYKDAHTGEKMTSNLIEKKLEATFARTQKTPEQIKFRSFSRGDRN